MLRGIIDLDNVVSEWFLWVMEQQDEVPKLAGLRSGRLSEMWDLTREQVDEIVQDLRGYTEVDVVPGAYLGVWNLWRNPRVEFLYVSAAPEHAVEGRYQWLQENYLPTPQPGQLIHLGTSAEKVDWIHEYGEQYDFIVDDALSHLDAALFAGIDLRMAYHRPWNQQDEDNHIRVHTWKEVISLIHEQSHDHSR